LKAATGTAWAGIIASDFLDQFLVAVNDTLTSFDVRFRREAASSLAGPFKSRIARRRDVVWTWLRLHSRLNNAPNYNIGQAC